MGGIIKKYTIRISNSSVFVKQYLKSDCAYSAGVGTALHEILRCVQDDTGARQLTTCAINDMAAVAMAGIAFQHNRLVGTLEQRLIIWDTASVNTDGDIYQNMNNVNRALSISGIYQYLWRSFTVSTGLDNRMQYGPVYQELDAYYSASPKQNHPDNDMTGVFAGKNALFIMLESIDTWMLTPEYMPNLYGVQQDSIQFVNHYSPMFISAGTFNTEFTANTGLIPPHQRNQYPCICGK